eukprot:m.100535 g.100535  ORF g.100535 m.100535 type:complete len:104 (+) comp9046_c4_seq1:2645-2956(+)
MQILGCVVGVFELSPPAPCLYVRQPLPSSPSPPSNHRQLGIGSSSWHNATVLIKAEIIYYIATAQQTTNTLQQQQTTTNINKQQLKPSIHANILRFVVQDCCR